MSRSFYELLLGVSFVAFAGDCDNLKVFILWHAICAVIALYSAYRLKGFEDE